jgi:DnaJ-class molecular chaperone
MGRLYADQTCDACAGTGVLETTTVTGWAAGYVDCTFCGGEGSI